MKTKKRNRKNENEKKKTKKRKRRNETEKTKQKKQNLKSSTEEDLHLHQSLIELCGWEFINWLIVADRKNDQLLVGIRWTALLLGELVLQSSLILFSLNDSENVANSCIMGLILVLKNKIINKNRNKNRNRNGTEMKTETKTKTKDKNQKQHKKQKH
jgi:hypothetical protein